MRTSALATLLPALWASAVSASPLSARDTVITTSTTGNAGGYYFSCYIENGTGVTMDISSGSYKLQWDSSSEDVVAGIGWETGAVR